MEVCETKWQIVDLRYSLFWLRLSMYKWVVLLVVNIFIRIQNLVHSSTRWQHVSNFIELGVRALQSVGSCGR